MKFKRRLRKEKARRELKAVTGELQMQHADARRYREIARRVTEIKRAPVYTPELQAEMKALTEEVARIRAKYRGKK